MAHRMTLLQMVQSIMTSMDSDSVNSISDLIESQSIADTIKDVYFDLIARRDWEHLKTTTPLEAVSNVSQPTKIKIPDDIYRIDVLKYNKKLSADTSAKYEDVTYLPPEEFLDLVLARNSAASNISAYNMDNGTPLYIIEDHMPTYWTSFDNEYIYFDSISLDDEATVQASRSLIYGVKEPAWTASDTFIPDLPAQQFPLLLETARKTCFKRFKQAVDEESERSSVKQYNSMRHNQFRVGGGAKFFNWGIKRRR